MMRQPPPPRAVLLRLETDRFLLRTLTLADASDRWGSWLGDMEVMSPINTPPRTMVKADIVRYLQRFDNITRLIVGIFDKGAGNLHVGLYQIDIHPVHRTAKFNVIIGDKSYWGRKVVLETREVLLDHLFRNGVEKAIGLPLARNFPAVFNYKAQGWRLEGILKGQVRHMTANMRLDQYQFGLLKEDWIAMKEKADA